MIFTCGNTYLFYCRPVSTRPATHTTFSPTRRVFPIEPSIGEVEVRQPIVTYEIVEEGTKRRKQKLIVSLEYSYNINERGKASTYWQCTVRPKGSYSKATVRETGRF